MNQNNQAILDMYYERVKAKDTTVSKTYKNRRFVVKKFIEFIESKGINDILDKDKINRKVFEDYIIKKRNEGSMDSNIVFLMRFIKAFYVEMLNMDMIDDTILTEMSRVPKIKVARKLRPYLTKEDIDDIIEMMKGFYTALPPYKYELIIWFLFYTGLRKSEFLNLRRDAFDLKNNSVLVRLPNKVGKERLVYYPEKVKNMIKTLFQYEPIEEQQAFNVTIYNVNTIIKHMNDYTKKHISWHTLRHSFGSFLAESDVNIKIAQELLGHASIVNTSIYYKPSNEKIKESYQNIFKKKDKK